MSDKAVKKAHEQERQDCEARLIEKLLNQIIKTETDRLHSSRWVNWRVLSIQWCPIAETAKAIRMVRSLATTKGKR